MVGQRTGLGWTGGEGLIIGEDYLEVSQVNDSLSLKMAPLAQDWKTANTTLIFKKGFRGETSNVSLCLSQVNWWRVTNSITQSRTSVKEELAWLLQRKVHSYQLFWAFEVVMNVNQACKQRRSNNNYTLLFPKFLWSYTIPWGKSMKQTGSRFRKDKREVLFVESIIHLWNLLSQDVGQIVRTITWNKRIDLWFPNVFWLVALWTNWAMAPC